jgi:aryl-alcohol dehydrogenase-like predicted oxidoreductase
MLEGRAAARLGGTAMQQRSLGRTGLQVSAIGLGCMGLTPIYGNVEEADAIAAVHRAIELGVNFLDSSDAYAFGANEERVAKAIAGKRHGLIVATKFGQIRHPDGSMDVSGTPAYVAEACEASLKRLKLDVIDLYYQHRVDATVPIEDTVGAMVRLKEQGKIRHLGLSEAAPGTIRRAHKVHPIAALQTEYSLWTRDVEHEILPTCRELGIGFVAYSPLGRGFLSATIRTLDSLEKDDRRRAMPRYQGDNLTRNVKLLDVIETIAQAKGCTSAAVAIAWTLARGPDIVPIPGTKRRAYLEQNVVAERIRLAPDDMAALERAFPPGVAAGERYPAEQMKRLSL